MRSTGLPMKALLLRDWSIWQAVDQAGLACILYCYLSCHVSQAVDM
jgi:hypothetical protein